MTAGEPDPPLYESKNAAEKEVRRGEENISAQQPLEKKDTWVPCAYEDKRRSPRNQEKASAREKEALGIVSPDSCRGHRG